MSETSMQNSVKEFLKDVKKALPDWLKDKKEHKGILADLEEHIWEKARELSETGQPTEESVRKAIDHMGTPQSIAKEYKRRGTPKVYITAEMWPLYIKVLTVVFAVIIVLNAVGLVFNVLSGTVDLGQLIEGLANGIQLGLLFSFVIISIIFVVLSMEGYFPEDLKSKKKLKEEKKRIAAGKPPKVFIKPVGEIIGGGIGLIVGIVFLVQPFPTYMFVADFLLLLRFFGILMIIGGLVDITRGVIGNRNPGTHQVIHVFKILLKIAAIPFLVVLMNRPEIFPWFSTPWVFVGIPAEFYDAYRIGMIVLIVIVALTTIDDIYKIIKLESYKLK